MTDDFNARNIAEFRANHGKLGGNFEGAPMLLLHSIGAKSGEERISPVMYLADGDRYLVFASAAGADKSPAWYHNLVAHPDKVSVEVGDEHLAVGVEELPRAERDEKYAEQARRYPAFAEYEKRTTRVIPVLALTPTGSVTG